MCPLGQRPVEECSTNYGCRQVDTEQLGKFICRKGLLKIIALSFRAVLALERYKLRPGFHTLGYDLKMEAAPQIDDCTHYFGVVGIRAQSMHK